MVGKRFGKLVVIEMEPYKKGRNKVWKCKCDCGNYASVIGYSLRNGSTKSCGCIRINDLSGNRYGRLTVLSLSERRKRNNGQYRLFYKCLCDCGEITIARSDRLKDGTTKSCGCLSIEKNKKRFFKHGMSKTYLYKTWLSMINRCRNENCSVYKYYGGRGIAVCDEWKTNYLAFYEWAIANGYNDDKNESGKRILTIDRIDNDKGYSPDNCRWITFKEQQRNRRNNRYVDYKGEKVPLSVVSEAEQIPYTTLCERLNRGCSINEAIAKSDCRIKRKG